MTSSRSDRLIGMVCRRGLIILSSCRSVVLRIQIVRLPASGNLLTRTTRMRLVADSMRHGEKAFW
jgi:hypothetical protein